jgi:branched-chain amino acid transport system ATP-binding protein
MLDIQDLEAGYGPSIVLRDVSLQVPDDAVVAVVGPNGGGKTTLLRTISGVLAPTNGTMDYDGEDLTQWNVHERSRRGVCHIPEGRGIFPSLSVRENLLLQAPRGQEHDAIEQAITAFPALGSRLRQTAGTLSGGEQQMLAMSRAYVCHPRLVLVDEPSLGLAPLIIDAIFTFLGNLRGQGVALLLVEQYVTRALALASHVYVMNRGRITFSGDPSQIDEDEMHAQYLAGDRSADSPQ